ncbi:MAG: hypothetical protein OBKJMPBA_00002 [Methanophagales virus PBV304]|uniref:Uncharacterized protein n=1 Tax=Methanophagales virus PBV304 TaxID=3071309 RepID=A0AA46YIU0_9VIRU|nr:MAG: hypothetical protein QIT47_gp02 [Methanophagales virus PBV304]UYL65034.1 MAG: hypothetical protein OBKJMPBA_00002 [Methanophagales virus PBV304]
MALLEPFMVKTSLGTGADTAVELTAKTGESLLVKDVIINGSNDEYVLLEVEKTTVGFFRVDGHVLGSHLPVNRTNTKACHFYTGFRADASITLISYMIKKGWMRGYPVAEGQTFRVKPFTSGKKLNDVIIVYEKYDAGDIKATDFNGSEAKEYVFVNYGRVSQSIKNAKDYDVNTCVTTEEFPDFPFSENVPSKATIDILGILGSEVIDYDNASNYVYTKFLKMFKGRTCLFDRDKQGLPFYAEAFSGISAGTYIGRGFSVIGNYTSKDRREPFVPPALLSFKAGDEVKVFITAGGEGSTAEITAKYAEIAFIEKVTLAE